jgi:cyclic beta-1,2-glucan synthetase
LLEQDLRDNGHQRSLEWISQALALTKSPPLGLTDRIELLGNLRNQADELSILDDHPAAYWLGRLKSCLDAWSGCTDEFLGWVMRMNGPDPAPERVELVSQEVPSPSLRELAGVGGARSHVAEGFAAQAVQDEESTASPASMANAQQAAAKLVSRIERLTARIDELSAEVDLRFLYDTRRRLFAIGYNVSEQRRDGAYYDMLASEARLGSFVSIARGEVPVEHWLSMSRPYGSRGRARVLMSWTGTMFEYLMPHLFQRTFPNSLLEKATEEAVQLQIEYAEGRGVPWGISESAFGDLDLNRTYQYRAFGVPWLGLKRGLDEDLVVAPYATMLALPFRPARSVENLRRLEASGLRGEYGFFEAIDYSRRDREKREQGVIVRAYMAHHQGMSFLALANQLLDGVMQRRFHHDLRVIAAQPLLFERVPVSPVLHHVPTREELPSPEDAVAAEPSVSSFSTPHTITPRIQMLSNGRYHAMVTAAGGGYSRWRGRDISRFRADTTRDSWGSFLYVRDIDSDEVWSNAYHPVGGELSGYEARFPLDRAEFSRRDAGIQTETEIIVSPEDDVEIRRVTFVNRSLRMRYLEVTSYIELAMAEHSSDRQHPAFNKLFIETEAVDGGQILLAKRRPRSEEEKPIFVGHRLTFVGAAGMASSYETDRRVFIGRGRTLRNPIGLTKELGNTAGFVLDPIFSLRGSVRIPAGQEREVSLITAVGESREEVLRLMEKFVDPAAIGRAFELSWTSTQLSLRMMRIHPDEARRFQKLASYMIYPSGVLRPPEVRIRENRKGQSGLWPYAISGDNPIALVSIGEAQDLPLVRQLLQAHGYWRRHGLVADLVILNEESSSYERPMRERLQRLVQALAPHAGLGESGGIYLLSADQIPPEDIDLLLAAARVSLVATRGPLAQQLGTPSEFPEWPEEIDEQEIEEEPSAPLPYLELPYFNSLGGFTPDGREYVIYLGPGTHTPAPWVNVISNPSFGTLVSESGASFTWYGNSQRNRLTAWSNDPVVDPAPEAVYLQEENSGAVWTPTPYPMRGDLAYRAHHGSGYSLFEHNRHGIECQLTQFVPVDDDGGDPIKVSLLKLHNDTDRTRRITVTYYVEWTLGEAREETQQHVTTEWDEDAGSLLARNYYHPDYPSRVAFVGMSPRPIHHTGDRTEFLGRNGSADDPVALHRKGLSGRVGAGFDPCGAIQSQIELAPGEVQTVVMLLGQAQDSGDAHHLLGRYRERLASENALDSTKSWWDELLSAVQVDTPELSANFMVNRWLLYQSLSCRMWGRSALYQSGGAFGFRDQLQDALAMTHVSPEIAREQILLAASRQFEAGDVQHWWHPPHGSGVRTRISDDLLWLPFAVEHYVKMTGDVAVLVEQVPFLHARELEDGEQETLMDPAVSGETATLFEHCHRALARGLTSGPSGLPLFGTGDWNDGMNQVGINGRGESVWLAWFLVKVLGGMADLAQMQGLEDVHSSYAEKAKRLVETIEREAWDGAWYLRGKFDNGKKLGSSSSEEGWIDSLPQSWAWLAGGGDPKRAQQALESAWRHLVRNEDQLVLLFAPPFDRIEPSPGYIRGYPPGVRENGGQYTHAALWLAMAFARSGDGDRAVELLRLLNPVEHAKDVYGVWRYGVEPYAVAADVYRLVGRVGQGGWTWYTGSAAWMYRAWMEEVLGIRRRGETLEIDPVIPQWWEGFSLRYRHGKAIYWIEVMNPEKVSQGVVTVQIDGRNLADNRIPLERTSIKHRVQVRMGKGETDKT